MAPQPKKRSRLGTRKTKERARGARPKSRGRSAGGAKRARARSKPKRTRGSTRKSAGRVRRSRQAQGSDTLTFEERLTPETELAKRAADAMVGDEEPGGSVETPDHDLVDQWAGALGVERSPDSPVRSSAEVLEDRDRRREGRRPAPKI